MQTGWYFSCQSAAPLNSWPCSERLCVATEIAASSSRNGVSFFICANEGAM